MQRLGYIVFKVHILYIYFTFLVFQTLQFFCKVKLLTKPNFVVQGDYMKKIFAFFFLILSSVVLLCSCAGKNDEIYVISREDGSGTRLAFTELSEILEKQENGELFDKTTPYAEITNNTAVMMTSVMSDVNSIGYISLGSISNIIKPLKIEGVEPTVENIKSGDYKLARPFLIAVKDNISPITQDFINFILSKEGQQVVKDKGYAPLDGTESFNGSKISGKIVIAGSSSVSPVMESLKESYLFRNPNAEIEIQQSDSTTGLNALNEGICDIAMTSRQLKDSETAQGISSEIIAMDGIVLIVNNDNPIDNLTKQEVKDIYTGKTTAWSAIGQETARSEK